MKTAICVAIKNEQDYLEEWLQYHLNLGIDKIFLYEDYDSVSHKLVVEPFKEKVTLEPLDVIFTTEYKPNGFNRQEKLFDWFYNIYNKTFDWILFIDLDEFLVLKQSLHDLLKEYDDKPGILLRWKYYGASGHIDKPKGSVIDSYTKQSPSTVDFYWGQKSFLNCKKFYQWENMIHKVKDAVFPINEFGDHKAYLKHYFTKSWQEWKEKLLSRGDMAPGNRKIVQFFEINPDLNYKKNELLLEIAIENAIKLGFNKHYNKDIDLSNKKFLHFCWFGGNQFNEMNLLCINSWKKFLSEDFIVCLWNEFSFGYYEFEFTKEAYNSKYWAYVSDYARLWCIYNFGGVYLDTDVELIKPIDDLPSNFFAIEKEYNSLAPGLGFGAEKNNEVIGDLLSIYNDLKFDKNNVLELSIPKIVTDYFILNEYEVNNKEINEHLGFTIYPDYYFCPKSHLTKELNLKDETISIHHYHESWVEKS